MVGCLLVSDSYLIYETLSATARPLCLQACWLLALNKLALLVTSSVVDHVLVTPSRLEWVLHRSVFCTLDSRR